MAQSSSSPTSTRELRENLREMLEQASKGKEVLVTLRGRPYVRIVPIRSEEEGESRHPLRGSVRFIADDFDAPMTGLWDALQKKAPKPRRKKK